jgi:1-acyl-sn-glycerol-3-phosphate acyltransferase
MKRWIYKLIFLKILGWKIEGHTDNFPKKYLIVVAPHTSNWDFFIGLFTRGILRGFYPRYLAKKELFVSPIGYIFRWLGGYPVERTKNTNFVDSVVDIYQSREQFVTTITPEGTRSYSPNWKTGFYYIAQKADVPVMRVGFDYGNKKVILDTPKKINDNLEDTIMEYKKYFSQFKGKNAKDGVIWPE